MFLTMVVWMAISTAQKIKNKVMRMKPFSKCLLRGIAFVLAFVLLYILFFGPVEAWFIRCRDRLGRGEKPKTEQSIWLIIYTPLLYVIENYGGYDILASYTGMWYWIRDGIDGVFEREEYYEIPATNLATRPGGL